LISSARFISEKLNESLSLGMMSYSSCSVDYYQYRKYYEFLFLIYLPVRLDRIKSTCQWQEDGTGILQTSWISAVHLWYFGCSYLNIIEVLQFKIKPYYLPRTINTADQSETTLLSTNTLIRMSTGQHQTHLLLNLMLYIIYCHADEPLQCLGLYPKTVIHRSLAIKVEEATRKEEKSET